MTVFVRAPTCTANRSATVQIRQTGFLLYNIAVCLYCYLDSIRCSWIITSDIPQFWLGNIRLRTRLDQLRASENI